MTFAPNQTHAPSRWCNGIDHDLGCADRYTYAVPRRQTPRLDLMGVDSELLEHIGRQLLVAIGEDPDREGLKDTPARFARAWREFMSYDPGTTDTSFSAVQSDQLVLVGPMRVWSMCEHHLQPFWCDITVGYVSGDSVLGVSKFARIAHQYAHRLQLQERLVAQIAQHMAIACKTEDVAVYARGEHLCMVSRGIKTSGYVTSSSLNGGFRTNPELRREFLHLATR